MSASVVGRTRVFDGGLLPADGGITIALDVAWTALLHGYVAENGTLIPEAPGRDQSSLRAVSLPAGPLSDMRGRPKTLPISCWSWGQRASLENAAHGRKGSIGR